jgi:DNA topoisomerase-3
MEQCTEVVNCGDAGIEGELIQRWVLAKAANNKPVKRLWISSMTDEAIKEGFENLKDSKDYDLLYAAGNARAIGDWLLGMNASRLYTVKYAQGKGVLSIGTSANPYSSINRKSI